MAANCCFALLIKLAYFVARLGKLTKRFSELGLIPGNHVINIEPFSYLGTFFKNASDSKVFGLQDTLL